MASATRSRRTEAPSSHLQTRSLAVTNNRALVNAPAGRQNHSSNPKRGLDDSGQARDPARSPKRAKLTINLLSSPPNPPHRPAAHNDAVSNPQRLRLGPKASSAENPAKQNPQQALKGQQPRQRQLSHQTEQIQSQQTRSQPSQTAGLGTIQRANITQPAENAPSGRQNGANTAKAPEGRKLRSQEATRFKSDLAAYFPEYDEVIGNDKKPDYALEKDTPILLTDPATTHPSPQRPEQARGAFSVEQGEGTARLHNARNIRSYGDHLFTELVDSQEMDFVYLEGRTNIKSDDGVDPLPDSYFEPTHKKAERAERSIRNSERGRAQHEKEQVIRLLDGLQGHDWLRTMGVSGITESKKKDFEKARQHFIGGCEGILEKFRRWNEEEKRRKMEKGRAAAQGHGPESGEDHDSQEENDSAESSMGQDEEDGREEVEDSQDDGNADPLSDVDASIAKQLREESNARSKPAPRKAHPGSRRAPAAAQQAASSSEPAATKIFVSFFDKKYQREAALSKVRRKGRTVLAWGYPIPEMAPVDFEVPPDILDEKTLRSNERRKRRDKRGTKP